MKTRFKIFYCFFILSVFLPIAEAQNKLDNIYLSAYYQYGVGIPEYSNLAYLINEPVHSVALTLSRQTFGKKIWEQYYNYPQSGISLFYTTLGNQEVHGSEFAIFPFTTLHIINKKKFKFDNTIGIGLSYATKKYDKEKNYKNVAIASHLNIHFNFKLGIQYYYHQKSALKFGMAFDHLSNGNIQEPNLGLNNLTLYGGISYLLGNQTEFIQAQKPDHKSSLNYEVILGIGAKRGRALASRYFMAYSLSGAVNWKLRPCFRLGAGLDVFYDQSTEFEMISTKRKFRQGDEWSSGVFLAQEIVYNRLSIIIQEGFYVIVPNKAYQKLMYNRGIVKFQINKHLSARIAMKSHLHILDYPELGIGVCW